MITRSRVGGQLQSDAEHGLSSLAVALLVLFLWAAPGSLTAQQTGTITGRVVDATGQGIGQAQVFIQELDQGSLTRADGGFLIVNVPAGTHSVSVERVGFGRRAEEVTVAAGETVTVNFQLTEEAIALDEVVVTGLPTESRRREIGNAMGTIDVSQEVQQGSVENVEDILQGSGPGVMSLSNQGQVGAGGSIQLRGITSATQGNEPLVYVDGQRISTSRTPPGAAFDGRNTRNSSFIWNEINMEDVERIEIIKGAAATSLYGTEANAGVIQIFTKKGTTGAPSWTVSAESGVNMFPRPSSVIQQHPTWLDVKEHDQVGKVFRGSASVSGGTEAVRYRLSLSGGDEEGIVPTQWSRNVRATANADVRLTDGLNLQLTNTYSHRRTREVSDGNNRYGYMLNVLRVGNGYFAGNRDQSWVLEQEYFTDIDNFITGGTLRWALGDVSQTFRLGLNHADQRSDALQPFGWHLNPRGTISQREWTNRLITYEYTGNWATPVTGDLRSTFSWGGQAFDERTQSTVANGRDFPGPGNHTVSSASLTTGGESYIREINGGFFLQEQLAYDDRLFLTGAVRFDGNSSFGEDFGIEIYPKLSASWVVSDRDRWPEWWNSLRLRASLGQAGKAPGAFDAQRTWNPISARGGQAGVSPGNIGDPNLGPERTTEYEAGFETDFVDGRLGLEFTYYNATTEDALFNVQPIPSQGFLSSQLSNVGKLRSSGVEASVNAVILQTRALRWSAGWDVTTIDSEVLDMGGAAPFSVSRLAEIREGHPAPSQFGRKVTNPNEFADPEFESDAFLGQVFPDLLMNFRSRLSYGPLTLSGTGELVRGGHNTFSVGWLNTIREAWPGCTEVQEKAAAGDLSDVTARMRARCLRDFTGADQFVESSDFFKLRNVTLTWQLPEGVVPAAFSTASLSATGRNLVKISDYPGLDPESHQGGANSSYREDYYTIPPRMSVVTKLRLTF